ncbi:MAG TPA: TspO/MBR family protein, partial [Terriglobales bacterium]
MSKWIVLCMSIAMGLVAGAIGAWFTAVRVRFWYPTLLKPADTPPSSVFGLVWSTQYVLMGTAAWLIWQQRSAADATVAVAFFFDQLLL